MVLSVRYYFRWSIGPKCHASWSTCNAMTNDYVGDETQSRRVVVTLDIATNVYATERIWHLSFLKSNLEPTTHIVFELLNVLAIDVVIQAVHTLCASGRTSGSVMPSGDCVSLTFPSCEDSALRLAIPRLVTAGRDLI